jgi:uncharacterized membrane protein YphA (DoxX/SURF4 family)
VVATSTRNPDGTARRVALAVGVVFVIASTPKFLAYGWEVDNFRRFGLPVPGPMVLLAGVLELAGGALLIAGRLVGPVCVVLSAVMVVAIATSGVHAGDVVPSLTVAPVLLAAMVWLLARGPATPAAPSAPARPRSAPPRRRD